MYKTKTLRFEVDIDPNNLDNYELSLLDLIKRDTLIQKNGETKEEINKMLNLVKEMEAKYGPVAVVKGKRIRVNDFVDQGDGYDADDPFIDDSGDDEALVVAPDLMTEHGGFFINRNSLNLREGNFVIDRVEGGNSSMDFPKKSFSHKKITKKTKSQKLLSQARKRLTTSSKSNSSLRRIGSSNNEKLEEIINNIVATTNVVESDKIEIVSKTIKKSDVNDTQVPNIAQDKDNNIAQVANVPSSPTTKILQLPAGLPAGTLEKIRALQEISDNCKNEGKKIDPKFDITLLELDKLLPNNSKDMKTLRTNVLRYVGSITTVKYNSILRRILKVKDHKKQQTMKPLFQNLEDAIKVAMIDSLAIYEHNMKHYLETIEAQKLSTTEELPVSSTEQLPDSRTVVETKQKTTNKIKTPKRFFKWTVTCKKLLFDLVCGEMEAFKISNSKSTPEDYLNRFYQTSVICLFEPKWMTVSQLMKISIPLLSEFKQCIASGREFRSFSPNIKQKSRNNIDERSVSPLKEAVISIPKWSNGIDVNDGKVKVVTTLPNKPVAKVKVPSDLQIKTEIVKVPVVNQPASKIPKILNSPIHLKPKPTVRSSSIISPYRVPNLMSPLTVTPPEAVKRYADGSCVLSPNSLIANHGSENHGFNLMAMETLTNLSNHSSSYLQNYQYPHNNHMEQLSRNAISSTSPSCLGAQCSQQTVQFQLPPQQHLKQPQSHNLHLHQQKHQNLQPKRQAQTRPGNDFVHSTHSELAPENITRAGPLLQNVPNLVSSSYKGGHIDNSQHTLPVQNNHNPSNNIHQQYMALLAEYEAKGTQSVYHSQVSRSNMTAVATTTIDLTGDSPSNSGTNNHVQQLSPQSLFVNMNTAHCPNNRHFQN